MPSLIPGYNYDIFISYRQKDNKGEHWVSEFVESLKTELESTFKEEISVYFDINPHDGLLETHDVDESLKEKLKCLVFIPVISRTYCDPKSFAWKHEFKAFVEMASKDQFGLKIKLPNGNVASRVLPVCIYDLDNKDIKLCESVLGSILRGIEFIYKEPGVNRPLKPDDDEKINLNKSKYRNQINKISNALFDLIDGITSAQNVIELGKNIPEKKEEKVGDITPQLINYKTEVKKHFPGLKKVTMDKKVVTSVKKRKKFLWASVLGMFLVIPLSVIIVRKIMISHAVSESLPEIEMSWTEGKRIIAFSKLQKIRKYMSDNPEFNLIDKQISTYLTIHTEPPEVKVFCKEFTDSSGKWEFMGTTPIDSQKVPREVMFRFLMAKDGYDTVIASENTTGDPYNFFRKLFPRDSVPEGMIFVAGRSNDSTTNFFIDKFEVTNKQYKEFIRSGGYQNKKYWKYPFIKDKESISWEDAIKLFTDQTGVNGPSTWTSGDYPESQANYPVSGISWYEAAAYAECYGKELPTVTHWNKANSTGWDSYVILQSNFNNKGPAETGQYNGINRYGAYDMAGNVREWCFNEQNDFRIIRGGSWSDPTYVYRALTSLPPFDRSEKNGFRCIKYPGKKKAPKSFYERITSSPPRIDRYNIKQSDDKMFQTVINQFAYPKTDLNPVIEKKDEIHKNWTAERITINTVYDKSRMIIYLFLPKNFRPPYQVAIVGPTMGTFTSGEDYAYQLNQRFDFLVKNGRAFICPIFWGSFERKKDMIQVVRNTRFIRYVQDISRVIDYLSTRSDLDTSRIALMGGSYAGMIASLTPAVEKRIRTLIMYISGFGYTSPDYPEWDQVNFVARIKIPTLMLNGEYDNMYKFDSQVKPFFDLLGTPDKDKVLKVYKTDHGLPHNEVVKETQLWLDKYLGSVDYQTKN